MPQQPPDTDRTPPRASILDAALRIGLVAALAYTTFRIITPFMGMLLWAAILAVMLYPLHRRLAARLGNRWSALLIGLIGVVVTLVPIVVVVASLAETMMALVGQMQSHQLVLPPPPARLADLPLIGTRLSEAWALAATNAPAAFAKYRDALTGPATWVLSFARGLLAGEVTFVVSCALAGVLVAYGEGAAAFTRRLMQRITGSAERGTRLVTLTAATIRGVAIGVVGVATIQALLLGIGFFAIGLPAAGLLTLATLLLCIVQVPAMLLTLPVIGYVFATEATGTAVVFAVWTLVAGLSDNVLKPMMLGRGLEVPMPVILVGVIGGMISEGLIGLFVGPVLLAVAYVLLMEWLRQHPSEGAPPEAGNATAP
ncbi:AI-2E family transporter [Kaistia dalseonensis]|uniref:PurR-regulated permease PerM n=1 Tax=Kaistia dalseonensis TaxID=410840 RepID=A0ABU0H9U7_9HYPH|nr:AI-2E family transporter [Kaistia dalseonensis]MCX5496460.1 AI-2E family transporter [Kaistia dalseonensis]MDQ0439081.1 putative PurR-regulated permease PerM [Kaistia dalseonensis]